MPTVLGDWLLATSSPRGRCIISQGEMEYIRTSHTFGIHSHTFAMRNLEFLSEIHRSFTRVYVYVYVYVSHSFRMHPPANRVLSSNPLHVFGILVPNRHDMT
jgi:hypothetical protein